MEKEGERERERERALNKRIMSSAARDLAKKVFVHTERRKIGGLFRPTSVCLIALPRPSSASVARCPAVVVFLAPFRPRDNVDKTLLRT